jgi:predicted acylesterase/phospholipase RssA
VQYSPSRRTALVLCGTGAHGAYHAGVLRAVQEAGVRIDLVAGHGIGAAGAMLAAIDGSARLWEPAGIWRSAQSQTLYAFTPAVRIALWTCLALFVGLLIPTLLVALTPSF